MILPSSSIVFSYDLASTRFEGLPWKEGRKRVDWTDLHFTAAMSLDLAGRAFQFA
jgi:hypothetical protein